MFNINIIMNEKIIKIRQDFITPIYLNKKLIDSNKNEHKYMVLDFENMTFYFTREKLQKGNTKIRCVKITEGKYTYVAFFSFNKQLRNTYKYLLLDFKNNKFYLYENIRKLSERYLIKVLNELYDFNINSYEDFENKILSNYDNDTKNLIEKILELEKDKITTSFMYAKVFVILYYLLKILPSKQLQFKKLYKVSNGMIRKVKMLISPF